MHKHLIVPLLFCLGIIVTLSACATSRSTVPPAVTSFPSYRFEVLRGTDVSLTVLDQRSERDESALLVSRVTESLTTALSSNGIQIDPGAESELEVRITRLRSDFELGNWKGCTSMNAVLRRQDGDERVEADRCVTRSNMLGYRSANEALATSFIDALSELLSAIDAL